MSFSKDVQILVVVLSAFISVSLALSATLHLTSFNASLNSSAHIRFGCTVAGANRADWVVNATSFDEERIVSRGITVVSTSLGDGAFETNLSIPARAENNNTRIECIATNFSDTSFHTPPALLRVQGLLDAPSSSIMPLNDSHRALVWDPPYTLDITDVSPDIQHYIVQESVTGASVNVNETEYHFLNLAVPITFSVSACNIVGKGETASVLHQACVLSKEQQAIVSSDVKSVVSFKEDGGVDLTFSFKWATNCIPLMNLEILNVSSGNIVAHFNSLIPSYHGSGAERTLSLRLATTADLLMNTHYTAHLTSISAQRELGAEGAVSFSTFDVQNVTVAYSGTSITATCHFATGASAHGCSVHIRKEGEGGAEVGEGEAKRNCTAEGVLSQTAVFVYGPGVVPGVYRVTVYDVEREGGANTAGQPALKLVVDVTPIVTTTPIPTPSAAPGTPPIPPPIATASSGDELSSLIGPIAAVVIGVGWEYIATQAIVTVLLVNFLSL